MARREHDALRLLDAEAPQTPLQVGLLRPPIVVNPRNLGYLAPVPPLGLAYLAAAVRAGGHRVQLVDSAGQALDRASEFPTAVGPMRRIGLTPEEAVERLDPGTQVVGVNLMFLHEWAQSVELVRAARRRFPEATIVMGGETVTACWERLLGELPEVDHVVLGEGERTFHALLGALSDGVAVPALDGLISRRAVMSGAPDAAEPTSHPPGHRSALVEVGLPSGHRSAGGGGVPQDIVPFSAGRGRG